MLKFWQKNKILIIILIILGSFVIGGTILAQAPPQLPGGINLPQEGSLADIVVNVINTVLGLLGLIAVIVIIVGGFKYMASGGDVDKTKAARKLLIAGLIGLTLIVFSGIIATYVISLLWGAGQPAEPAEECNECVSSDSDTDLCGCAMIRPCNDTCWGSWQKENPACSCPGACPDPDEFAVVPYICSISPQKGLTDNIITISGNEFGDYAEGVSKVYFNSSVDGTGFNYEAEVAECEGNPYWSDSKIKVNVPALPYDSAGTNYYYIYVNNGQEDVLSFDYGDGNYSISPVNQFELESDGAANNPDIICIRPESGKQNITPVNIYGRRFAEEPGEVSFQENVLASVSASSPDNWNNELISTVVPDQAVSGDVFVINDQGSSEGEDFTVECDTDSDCSSGCCYQGNYQNRCEPLNVCEEFPRIDSISPQDGAAETCITISGVGFLDSAQCTDSDCTQDAQVLFWDGDDYNIEAELACTDQSNWSSNQLVVKVPAGISPGPVKVINILGNSDNTQDPANGWVGDFTPNTTVRPCLCSTSPDSGVTGDSIEISGKNFGLSADGELFLSDIKFNQGSSWNWADNLISDALVPSIVPGSRQIILESSGIASNPLVFEVNVPQDKPTIIKIEPEKGPAGQYITIYGQNFGKRGGTVYFTNNQPQVGDYVAADVNFPPACGADRNWYDDHIIVKVPADADLNNNNIRVKTIDDDYSNQAGFNICSVNNNPASPDYCPLRPGICLIEPSQGPPGLSNVTIYGEYFGQYDNTNSKVVFADNQQAADSDLGSYWQEDQVGIGLRDDQGNIITEIGPMTVPGNAVTGEVVLTNNNQFESNSVLFTVADCRQPDADCPVDYTCCRDGSCSDTVCIADAEDQCKYQYAFTTTEKFGPPQVVEDVSCLNSTQSPSPYMDSEDSCQNAVISARFEYLSSDGTYKPAQMNTQTFITDNIKVYLCESDNNDCDHNNPEKVTAVAGSLSGISNNTGFTFSPQQRFVNDKWYKVILKGTDGLESNIRIELDGDKDGSPGGDYTWFFKTRNVAEDCTVDRVLVTPDQAFLETEEEIQEYDALPFAANCNILNPLDYDWNWYKVYADGQQEDPAQLLSNYGVAAVSTDAIELCLDNNNEKISCTDSAVTQTQNITLPKQTAAAKNEGLVFISAGLTVSEENGVARDVADENNQLVVDYKYPQINSFFPNNGQIDPDINAYTTIRGSNFGNNPGKVYLGSIPAQLADCPDPWNDNRVQIKIPKEKPVLAQSNSTYRLPESGAYSGMQIFYNFEENEEIIIEDKINDYDGQMTYVNKVNDIFGRAADFNGSSSYARILNTHLLDISQGASIEMWFKADSFDTNPNTLLSTTDGTNNNIFAAELIKDDDNRAFLQLRVKDSSSQYILRTAQSIIEKNIWTHFILSFDFDEDGNPQYNIYINGHNFAAGKNMTQNIAPIFSGGDKWLIGAKDFGTGNITRFFDGKIDNVALYKNALNTQDAERRYGLKKGQVLLLDFDGSGSQVTDSSGNNYKDLGFYDSIGSQYTSSPLRIDQGKFGKALDFDNSYHIKVLDNPSLRFNKEFSIIGWFKPELGSSVNTIWETADQSIQLGVFSSGNCAGEFCFRNNAGAGKYVALAQSNIIEDEWNFFAVSYDGASLKLFLNAQSNQFAVDDSLYQNNDLGDVCIGGCDSSFTGQLDNIAVYNKSLTDEELVVYQGAYDDQFITIETDIGTDTSDETFRFSDNVFPFLCSLEPNWGDQGLEITAIGDNLGDSDTTLFIEDDGQENQYGIGSYVRAKIGSDNNNVFEPNDVLTWSNKLITYSNPFGIEVLSTAVSQILVYIAIDPLSEPYNDDNNSGSYDADEEYADKVSPGSDNYIQINGYDKYSADNSAAGYDVDFSGNVSVNPSTQDQEYLYSDKLSFYMPPVITDITPDNGPEQQWVTIFGYNFGQYDEDNSKVYFYNQKEASLAPCQTGSWFNDHIIAIVPVGAESGDLYIETAQGIPSNRVNFEVNDKSLGAGLCSVINVNDGSNRGQVGTSIEADGFRFGENQNIDDTTSQLYFYDGTEVPWGVETNINSWNNQTIEGTIPNSALTGPVEVVRFITTGQRCVGFQIFGFCPLGEEEIIEEVPSNSVPFIITPLCETGYLGSAEARDHLDPDQPYTDSAGQRTFRDAVQTFTDSGTFDNIDLDLSASDGTGEYFYTIAHSNTHNSTNDINTIYKIGTGFEGSELGKVYETYQYDYNQNVDQDGNPKFKYNPDSSNSIGKQDLSGNNIMESDFGGNGTKSLISFDAGGQIFLVYGLEVGEYDGAQWHYYLPIITFNGTNYYFTYTEIPEPFTSYRERDWVEDNINNNDFFVTNDLNLLSTGSKVLGLSYSESNYQLEIFDPAADSFEDDSLITNIGSAASVCQPTSSFSFGLADDQYIYIFRPNKVSVIDWQNKAWLSQNNSCTSWESCNADTKASYGHYDWNNGKYWLLPSETDQSTAGSLSNCQQYTDNKQNRIYAYSECLEEEDGFCIADEDCDACGIGASRCVNNQCTPYISSFTPQEGAVGTYVTIDGCYLGCDGTFYFNNENAADNLAEAFIPAHPECPGNCSEIEASPGVFQIIIEVPSEADDGIISFVSSSGLTENTEHLDPNHQFDVNDETKPDILCISPEQGSRSQDITVIGKNFLNGDDFNDFLTGQDGVWVQPSWQVYQYDQDGDGAADISTSLPEPVYPYETEQERKNNIFREPFLDDNDNANWDNGEPYIDFLTAGGGGFYGQNQYTADLPRDRYWLPHFAEGENNKIKSWQDDKIVFTLRDDAAGFGTDDLKAISEISVWRYYGGDENNEHTGNTANYTITFADCGNGVIDGTESCDGSDLGGETCVSQGFESGNLSCLPANTMSGEINVGCYYDYSQCQGPPVALEIDDPGTGSRFCPNRLAEFGPTFNQSIDAMTFNLNNVRLFECTPTLDSYNYEPGSEVVLNTQLNKLASVTGFIADIAEKLLNPVRTSLAVLEGEPDECSAISSGDYQLSLSPDSFGNPQRKIDVKFKPNTFKYGRGYVLSIDGGDDGLKSANQGELHVIEEGVSAPADRLDIRNLTNTYVDRCICSPESRFYPNQNQIYMISDYYYIEDPDGNNFEKAVLTNPKEAYSGTGADEYGTAPSTFETYYCTYPDENVLANTYDRPDNGDFQMTEIGLDPLLREGFMFFGDQAIGVRVFKVNTDNDEGLLETYQKIIADQEAEPNISLFNGRSRNYQIIKDLGVNDAKTFYLYSDDYSPEYVYAVGHSEGPSEELLSLFDEIVYNFVSYQKSLVPEFDECASEGQDAIDIDGDGDLDVFPYHFNPNAADCDVETNFAACCVSSYETGCFIDDPQGLIAADGDGNLLTYRTWDTINQIWRPCKPIDNPDSNEQDAGCVDNAVVDPELNACVCDEANNFVYGPGDLDGDGDQEKCICQENYTYDSAAGTCQMQTFDVSGYIYKFNTTAPVAGAKVNFNKPGNTDYAVYTDADGKYEFTAFTPECGNGYLEGIEECDDGGTQDGDGCSAGCLLENIVFLSSGTYNGDLLTQGQAINPDAEVNNGIEGADAICQQLAENAGLLNPGDFKAWIADTTYSPNNDYSKIYTNRPYRLVPDNTLNSQIIANNWADLTGEQLIDSISVTESGNVLTGDLHVWSNVKNGDQYTGQYCQLWESDSGVGAYGLSSKADSDWAYNPSFSDICTTENHLYCFSDYKLASEYDPSQVSAEGEINFTQGLPYGIYDVTITAPGYNSANFLNILIDQDFEELNFEVSAGLFNISGFVYREGAVPLPIEGAELEIGSFYNAATDEAGRFSLNFVDAGFYPLTVTASGYASQPTRILTEETEGNFVDTGVTDNMNITRQSEWQIYLDAKNFDVSGTVSHSNTGDAIEGVSVYIGEYSAVTDANGEYSITDIPYGIYEASAAKYGFHSDVIDNLLVDQSLTGNNFQLCPSDGFHFENRACIANQKECTIPTDLDPYGFVTAAVKNWDPYLEVWTPCVATACKSLNVKQRAPACDRLSLRDCQNSIYCEWTGVDCRQSVQQESAINCFELNESQCNDTAYSLYCDWIVAPEENLCGNGQIDSGEECDDNYTGQQCTTGEPNCVACQCVPGEEVEGICGDGIVNQESEECDDGNNIDDDECNNNCKFLVENIVFVTSKVYAADFGGLSVADGECKKLAEEAGLANFNTYGAWLATNEHINTRIEPSNKAYFLQVKAGEDPIKIADDFDDIITSKNLGGDIVYLRHPINHDENGDLVDNEYVWTGTDQKGQTFNQDISAACYGWTSNSDKVCMDQSGNIGSDCDDGTCPAGEYCLGAAAGNTSKIDSGWANEANFEQDDSACSNQYHLYCFPGIINKCGNGIIDPGEECDDGCGGDGCTDPEDRFDGCDHQCKYENIVFVTSQKFTGNLKDESNLLEGLDSGDAGIESADLICQQLAENAGLYDDNYYKAWLADNDSSPNNRFFKNYANRSYIQRDGSRIADNWEDIVDGDPLSSPIFIYESGEKIKYPEDTDYVWTNVNVSGQVNEVDQNCSSWESTSGTSNTIGNNFFQDLGWTDYNHNINPPENVSCNQKLYIYCFADYPSQPVVKSPATQNSLARQEVKGVKMAQAQEPSADPAFCGNDFIDIGEECDDGNNDDNDGCSGSCEVESIFFIGNKSKYKSIEQLDRLCYQEASSAGLYNPSSYIAWVSDSAVSAADEVRFNSDQFANTRAIKFPGTGIIVTNGGLADNNIANEIKGSNQSIVSSSIEDDAAVWTNTDENGQKINDRMCINGLARIGRTNKSNAEWTDSNETYQCKEEAYHYCISVPVPKKASSEGYCVPSEQRTPYICQCPTANSCQYLDQMTCSSLSYSNLCTWREDQNRCDTMGQELNCQQFNNDPDSCQAGDYGNFCVYNYSTDQCQEGELKQYVVKTSSDPTEYACTASWGRGDMVYNLVQNWDTIPVAAEDTAFGYFLKVNDIMPTPYLWITDSVSDSIYKVRAYDGYRRTKTGTSIVSEKRGQTFGPFPVGCDNPSRTAVNAETGDVWVTCRGDDYATDNFNQDEEVVLLDIDGNELHTYEDVGSFTSGVVIDRDGNAFVVNNHDDNIVKLSGQKEYQVLKTQTVNGGPIGMTIDSNNKIWVSLWDEWKLASVEEGFSGSLEVSYTEPFEHSNQRVWASTADLNNNIWVSDYMRGMFWYQPNEGIDNWVVSPNMTSCAFCNYGNGKGVTLDLYGDVWMTYSVDAAISRFHNNQHAEDLYTNYPNGDPFGITGDSEGQIWTIDSQGGYAHVFSRNQYGNWVKSDYDLGLENEAITVSDMAGLNRAMQFRSGVYQQTYQAENKSHYWGDLIYSSYIDDPDKMDIIIELMISDDPEFPGEDWIGVADWNGLTNPAQKTGRYVRLRITMKSSLRDKTPVLWNLYFEE